MKLLRLPVWHPLLLATFPILFLYAYNIDEVAAGDLFLPLLAAIMGTILLWLALRIVTRDAGKRSLITSLLLALFFAYGHVRGFIFSDQGITSPYINVIMVAFWGLIFLGGAFLIIRARRNFIVTTELLNLTAVVLVVISLVNIGLYQLTTPRRLPENPGTPPPVAITDHQNLPDIYYIILDMYARQDTMQEVYHYDNSDFIDYLKDKGFYVASQGHSNYSHTALSLASSLNMQYVNYLAGQVTEQDQTVLLQMIADSQVSQFLRARGYRYVYVATSLDLKEVPEYGQVYNYKEAFGIRVSTFALGVLETTVLAPFSHFFGSHGAKTILNAFDVLADMPAVAGSKFVFAHIMSPHPPYLFDRNGPLDFNPLEPENYNYQTKYSEQARFISQKTMELVNQILSKSKTPPIILLQGDHGTWWDQGRKLAILNAYYFPDGDYHGLHPDISPVNSFRLIFDQYFGAGYGLLPNQGYLGFLPDLTAGPEK
ncbi:MAG: hypothetical protein V1780_01160 [Chloroflexota bacterium]